MKILLVEPFGKTTGHNATYARYLAEGLLKKGEDVVVVSFDGFLQDWTSQAGIRHLKATARFKLLRLLGRQHSSRLFSRLSGYVQTIATFFVALRCQRREGIDLVYFMWGSTPFHFVSAPFFRKCGLAYVLPGPGANVATQERSKLYRTAEWLLDQIEFLTFRVLRHKERIAIVRDASRDFDVIKKTPFLDRFYPVPISKIYIRDSQIVASKDARQHLNLAADIPVFLSFGVIHPSKCIKTIFEAAKSLDRKVLLVFAGKVEARGGERDPSWLAREYHLEHQTVIRDGFIPEEEIKYYYGAADAFILSFDKKSEITSGTFANACRFMVPPIVNDIGDSARLVREYDLGFTFATEDAASLKEAMANFLSLDTAGVERLKKNIRAFSLANSSERIVEEHLAIFRELVHAVRSS